LSNNYVLQIGSRSKYYCENNGDPILVDNVSDATQYTMVEANKKRKKLYSKYPTIYIVSNDKGN
jgi:hypothetical protein